MHRVCAGRFTTFVATVSDVETANAGKQVSTIGRRVPVRVGRDPTQRSGEKGPVPDASPLAVNVPAPAEDRSDVLARKADALATQAAGAACGVKVADCVPVLVADRASGAVAAIHSGWQGTEINVLAAGIAALREAIGDPGELVAAIGPHIEVCCFEVGEDIAERLRACAPEADAIDRGRVPRPHVDLRKIVRAQLAAAGISGSAVEDVRGCSKCDGGRFFSYRRDRENSGRLLAAIAVKSG